MKRLKRFHFLTLGIVFVLITGNQSLYAQEKLTAEQWRSDLRHFQQLIHNKYDHFFKTLPAKRFDSAVTALDARINSLDETTIRVEFAKLVAMFKVGHTRVMFHNGPADNKVSWVHVLPVKFYLFTEGLIIRSIDNRYRPALGGKVTRIGKTKVEDALELIRPAIAYENEQGYRSNLPFFLTLPEYLQATGIIEKAGPVTITYLKDGKENEITIQPEELESGGHGNGGIGNPPNWTDAYENFGKPGSVLWLKEPSRLRYFEYIPATRTVYVRHSAVQDEPGETIKDFFAKVFDYIDKNDVDKLVLDIRLNGGGNNYLNKPVITGVVQSRKINRRGHFYVITGRATFSAAQNLTNELEKYTEVIYVGEPTSENVNFFGDTRTEILPNSQLNIELSWLWWQNLDPRDTRPWTAPELATDMSFEDYRKGFDPAFEITRTYKADAGIILRLTELVKAARYDDAFAAASQYIKDPLHRYYRKELEDRINNYGYNLLGKNNLKEANEVFLINVKLFPESANVYDSYAESWWKLGNKEEAIKYYKLTLTKDPHGPLSENAKKMVKEIEEKKGF